jgi:hypothetical protein
MDDLIFEDDPKAALFGPFRCFAASTGLMSNVEAWRDFRKGIQLNEWRGLIAPFLSGFL